MINTELVGGFAVTVTQNEKSTDSMLLQLLKTGAAAVTVAQNEVGV